MSCHCWNHCTGERVRHFSASATVEACTQACIDRPGTLHDYFCSSEVNSTADCRAGNARIPDQYLEPHPDFPGFKRVRQIVIDRPDLFPNFASVEWGIGRIPCCSSGGCFFVPSPDCFGQTGASVRSGSPPASDYRNARNYVIGPSPFGTDVPLCAGTPTESVAKCEEAGCCCTIQYADGRMVQACYQAKPDGSAIDADGDGRFEDVPCTQVQLREYSFQSGFCLGEITVVYEILVGEERVASGWLRRFVKLPDPNGTICGGQLVEIVNPVAPPAITCTPSPGNRLCGDCQDFGTECPIDDTIGRCREAVFRPGYRPFNPDPQINNRTSTETGEDTELVHVFPQCQRNFYGKVGYPLYYGRREDAFALACIGESEFVFENQREAVVSEVDSNGDFAFRFSYLEGAV